jgi:aryl-phospho-beta-D-glucosidase BglC (GH1 family)
MGSENQRIRELTMRKSTRRAFLSNSAIAATTVATLRSSPQLSRAPTAAVNRLPRWRGFNLLDYFTPAPPNEGSSTGTTDDDFRWMVDWGFDFVRLPMAYPRYVRFDRSKPITPAEVLNFDNRVIDDIQDLVHRANQQGLHVSLDLHRAPGFCVNAGFQEPYNLWRDAAAQQAFVAHWTMWAERFREVSPKLISFDLVNEPCMREDMNDQHGKRTPVPGAVYRKVAKKTAEAIWSVTPDRLVVADGNDVGSSPIPEITDLNIGQSCRGYFPHYISHYRAPWVFKDPDSAPTPVWPGTIEGKPFGRPQLEEFYAPWIQFVKQGIGVHCGECGCWRETPHPVFMAWFGDVLDILTENRIGYALWNFRGDFGVLDSGRKDIDYEDWHGHKLDRGLLNLLQKH